MLQSKFEPKIAVVGLGYVGLPLAVAMADAGYSVMGFDVSEVRVKELQSGLDKTGEIKTEILLSKSNLNYTSNEQDIKACNCYILAVPTPIDEHKNPDLRPLIDATKTVGNLLSNGDRVIFESTVYPGATEEVCVPILEDNSGLEFNVGFWCGYSPERINPGDTERGIADIVKITSGSTSEMADFVDELYKSFVTAGTHKVQSIRIAEAAKVIENTQRDINIALINEFSIIFDRLKIDTQSVLEAAKTKWNFLSFTPGLVGGHCVSVDPYYLTHKASSIGYHPEIILAGRRINDGMGREIALRMVKSMSQRGLQICQSRILIMGLTFKENCPDTRNTGVVSIISELREFGSTVDVFDPFVDDVAFCVQNQLSLVDYPEQDCYDGVIVAVAHDIFKKMGARVVREFGKENHVLFDLKFLFQQSETDIRL